MNYEFVLEKLIALQQWYDAVRRKSILMVYRNEVLAIWLSPKITDSLVQESLLYHVGHLPMLASFLYTYANQPNWFSLGKTLEMLSIHDIGESLQKNDIVFHKKTVNESKIEFNLANEYLHNHDIYLQEIYLEFEELKTMEAKFARSIDKLAPMIIMLWLDADVGKERWKHYGITCDILTQKNRSYMIWNEFLLWFFEYVIDLLDKKFHS